MLAEQSGDRGDGGTGALEQRIAVLRITDRRRQHLAKRHRAVITQQQHPGLECAGHHRGEKPGAGNEVEAFAAIMRDSGAGRRDALAANDLRLAAPHVVEDDRHIAAGSVQMRLHHLQREGRGDRGVERIAAAFKDAHADRRRDPMRRGDHAEGAFDFGPRGEGIGIDIGHE